MEGLLGFHVRIWDYITFLALAILVGVGGGAL
jgi:hypothetical protein